VPYKNAHTIFAYAHNMYQLSLLQLFYVFFINQVSLANAMFHLLPGLTDVFHYEGTNLGSCNKACCYVVCSFGEIETFSFWYLFNQNSRLANNLILHAKKELLLFISYSLSPVKIWWERWKFIKEHDTHKFMSFQFFPFIEFHNMRDADMSVVKS